MDTPFTFTAENLLANLDKLGAWSAYGLALIALKHYFPKEDIDDGSYVAVQKEVELSAKIGCKYWTDVITKYHTEVGYKDPFHPGCVNEY